MSFTYKAEVLKQITSELYTKLEKVGKCIEEDYLEANYINSRRMNLFKEVFPKYKFKKDEITQQVLDDYFKGIDYIKYKFKPDSKVFKADVDVDFITLDIPEEISVFISKSNKSHDFSSTKANADHIYFYVYYYEYVSEVANILLKLQHIHDLCEDVHEVNLDNKTRIWLHKLQTFFKFNKEK